MVRRRLKSPGDNVSFKTSVNEDQRVMEWINNQSNITDSIRYLIEMDIEKHGVRNLQLHIPSVRTLDTTSGPFQEIAVAKEEVTIKPMQEDSAPKEEKADTDLEVTDDDISSWA